MEQGSQSTSNHKSPESDQGDSNNTSSGKAMILMKKTRSHQNTAAVNTFHEESEQGSQKQKTPKRNRSPDAKASPSIEVIEIDQKPCKPDEAPMT